MNLVNVIKAPVITEKSLEAAKVHNRYTFLVATEATKNQISQAVAKYFNVTVVSVLTTTKKGITKKTGKRRLPRTSPTLKKAAVTLKSGQTINLFELKA